jgi:DUF4097 and DUF4098 domain-containing protein YvlB
MPEFACKKPPTISLRAGGGVVEIVAEERDTAVVDITPYDSTDAAVEAARNAKVEMHGDTLVVAAPEPVTAWLWRRLGRLRITLKVPAGSSLSAKVASADLTARGRFGAASLNVASGDCYVEHLTESATVKTASGGVTVDRADQPIHVNSASGDISVGYLGADSGIHAASGDIRVGTAAASLRAVTASGDIDVHLAAAGQVRLRSASGDIGVGVAAGRAVWLDLSATSGSVRSDLSMSESAPRPDGGPESADLQLQARTMSGDIRIHRVVTSEAAA